MAATIEGILKEVRQLRSSSDGNVAARVVIEFPSAGNLEVIQELNRICSPQHLARVIILGEDEYDDWTISPTKKGVDKMRTKEPVEDEAGK